ncbi:quinone oxidoreductase [Paenibacillus sp. J2TS4]|uniref:quinone oxidoreductase family protein n=1 Tax=Paenibacillus sp. J2TS4 TaxID=2807194 RepID=UPI001B24B791|nr:quinone oxidoreductase [Paenibacillus sp. J2TS4]GIP32522.1 alcohol dehydrogenase [Paenibacillus sp. J2TS4]
MKAIRIHTYGGPEVMVLEDIPPLIPGPGEVLVRLHAASVNFLDVQHRRGDLVKQEFYKEQGGLASTLPLTPGSQGVGVVETLGPDCPTRLKVGDRVLIFGGTGTYATHAVTRADRIMPIPDELDLDQAAAGLTQGFLAYAFTHKAYPVKPGDWCLVQAAAGGLGLLLVQMAKLRGGRVIGVTSTEAKGELVRQYGAEEIIVSSKSDIAKEARRITEGRGVHVVYDGVGKDTFAANLDSLGLGGYLIIFGQASGYIPPFDLMTLQEKGSLFITRTNGLPYRNDWPEFIPLLLEWTRAGKFVIPVDRKYSLAEAAQAHARFEQRQSSGRILLLP